MPGPGGGLVQGLSDHGGGVYGLGKVSGPGGVPGPGGGLVLGGAWSRGRGVPGPTGVCSGGVAGSWWRWALLRAVRILLECILVLA